MINNKRYCVQRQRYCTMATDGGVCSVTACTYCVPPIINNAQSRYCSRCNGSGVISKFTQNSAWSEPCSNCNGTGYITVLLNTGDYVRNLNNVELAMWIAEHICKFNADTYNHKDVTDISTWLNEMDTLLQNTDDRKNTGGENT